MYNSEFGRRLRHQNSAASLGSQIDSKPRGSSSISSGRRSPSKPARAHLDAFESAGSSASSPSSSRSQIGQPSSHLADAFAANLMSNSPSTSSAANGAAQSSHESQSRNIPGSWIDQVPNSLAGTSSPVSRPESPRRRAVVPTYGQGNGFLDRPRTPSKRNGVQADRYLPARQDPDEQAAAFQLLPGQPATPHRQKRKMAPDVDAEKEEADHTFANLLGAEIFGRENHAAATAASTPHSSSSNSAPGSGSGVGGSRSSTTVPTTPTKRNLFSYSSPSSSRSRSGGGHGSGRGRSNSNSSNSSRRAFADETMRTERPLIDLEDSSINGDPNSTPRRRGDLSNNHGLFGSSKKANGANADSILSPHHRGYDTSPLTMESQQMLLSPRRTPRTISKMPFKVLDAPELADDFYLNLVDWSSSDTLAVGLNKSVYLWSARDSKVEQLVELKGASDKVTSLSWAGRGNHLAVGTQYGNVQIFDAQTLTLLRTMQGHSMRVGALAWNEHILTSGARDRAIYHRDVRVPEHHIRELNGHKQEVCNLEWNTETNQLASGGNDNKLLVWDSLNNTPLHRFSEHTAAVKAIAWSPHQQGILASGGGTADMKIRFWNTLTGSLLSEVDTGSQVCNLMWSRTSNEIVSTHGYSAGKIQNQIQLWRYPSMQQVATLTGHTMRVLYLAMSPDGETIVTGAGDETLRFWDLNTPSKGTQKDLVGFNSVSGGSLNPFAKLR
ncbi:unnamed protein product [Sympodiomycopsis kandeliae]